jgi:hypothetical protein
MELIVLVAVLVVVAVAASRYGTDSRIVDERHTGALRA